MEKNHRRGSHHRRLRIYRLKTLVQTLGTDKKTAESAAFNLYSDLVIFNHWIKRLTLDHVHCF